MLYRLRGRGWREEKERKREGGESCFTLSFIHLMTRIHTDICLIKFTFNTTWIKEVLIQMDCRVVEQDHSSITSRTLAQVKRAGGMHQYHRVHFPALMGEAPGPNGIQSAFAHTLDISPAKCDGMREIPNQNRFFLAFPVQ